MPNFLKHRHAPTRSSYRQEKLYSTAAWHRYRKAIISRRGGECTACGATPLDQHIHLDHIVPLVDGGEAFNELNIQILCRECHGRKTAKEVWGVGSHLK
jgi:5-methylcytosine-specific restriction enzyme A